MRTILAAILILGVDVSTAAAQGTSRWYAGGTLAASRITADQIHGITPAAGVIIGVRLTPAFSVEADVSRSFRTLTRTYSGGGQLELTPTTDLAVLAVWRSTAPGRVHAAGYTGLTFAGYRDGWVSAGQRSSTDERGGGVTAGLMFPVTITRTLSLAPEFGFTFGSIREEPGTIVRAGVRVLWGF